VGTVAYKVTKSIIPEDLDEQVGQDLQQTALQAYRALELRDYGRIDMRLAADGRVYVLEVNPNPWLHSTAEFAMAAKKAGRDHPTLIGEIVDLALARYRP
jgi:D-alanine-D-alanine ligase